MGAKGDIPKVDVKGEEDVPCAKETQELEIGEEMLKRRFLPYRFLSFMHY